MEDLRITPIDREPICAYCGKPADVDVEEETFFRKKVYKLCNNCAFIKMGRRV